MFHRVLSLLPVLGLAVLLLRAPDAVLAQVGGSTDDLLGVVEDEHGHALPGATILRLPDSVGTATDAKGRFRLKGGVQAGQLLVVRFIGFRPDTIPGPLPVESPRGQQAQPLRIVLQPTVNALDEVVVSETHHHLEEALATAHIDAAQLRETDRSSLAAALEAQPGVAVLRTGIGIAKPVIRGLYGQRVVVLDQGIKQEGQQWGTDHGLEMDAFGAERVELIKGPGSLLYGSDALGGAVRVLPSATPDNRTVHVELEGVARSVNEHLGGSVSAGTRQGRFWTQGRYSRQSFGDFAVPANSFVFQGFELDIVDGLLKNTAGREEAASLSLGWIGDHHTQRLHLSRFDQAVGLFSGAVGIPRSYALSDDGDRRDIDNPSQSVRHDKLSYHYTLDGFRWDWTFDAGLQRNLRREFSFPEFHSLPVVDPTDNLALELDLWTASVAGHADRDFGNGWSATLGADGQWQQNRAAGFERFLPPFRLWRSGVYGIAYLDAGPGASDAAERRWTFGLRLDAGGNQSDFQQRYIYTSEGSINDSLQNQATDTVYGNLAGSVGYNRTLGPAMGMDWSMRSHLGKSFRIPHPAEMVSNGVHHGTFRHEMGNPDLRSEHGYQLDLGLIGERLPEISAYAPADMAQWRIQLDAFANVYQGFIYLSPSGKLSPLPEAGQVFAYRQDDAVFGGGELQVDFLSKPFGRKGRSRVEAVFAGEAVFNRNLESGLPLPFTPPVSLRQRVGWRMAAAPRSGRGPIVQSAQVFAVARYTMAQNRVDRNEATTPGYFLLEAGAGMDLRIGQQSLQLLVKGFNLLDAAYLNHLSRYRLIQIPEPGRNVTLSLRVPLLFATGE